MSAEAAQRLLDDERSGAYGARLPETLDGLSAEARASIERAAAQALGARSVEQAAAVMYEAMRSRCRSAPRFERIAPAAQAWWVRRARLARAEPEQPELAETLF